MNNHTRLVFISPHLDDAIWSCGDFIRQLTDKNKNVLIVTIFSSVEQELGSSWRNSVSSYWRKIENDKAVKSVRVKHISLGFYEAALRKYKNKYIYENINEIITNIYKSSDDFLFEAVYLKLFGILKESDIIFSPVGQGHVDHVITSNIVDQHFEDFFHVKYEDFPYPISIIDNAYSSVVFEVDIESWISTALIYKSQIRIMFGQKYKFINNLKSWSSKVACDYEFDYGIRFWKKNNIDDISSIVS